MIIPYAGKAIESVTNETKEFAQNGDLPAAAEQLEQLVGWLSENGQFNTRGVERAGWLAKLQTGEDVFAGQCNVFAGIA